MDIDVEKLSYKDKHYIVNIIDNTNENSSTKG